MDEAQQQHQKLMPASVYRLKNINRLLAPTLKSDDLEYIGKAVLEMAHSDSRPH